MNSISISISIDFTFIHIHPHPLLTALIHESLTRLKIASRHCDSLSWACEREREGESCHCCCQARVVEARPICATTHTTLVSYFGVMSVGQRRREPAGMQGGGSRQFDSAGLEVFVKNLWRLGVASRVCGFISTYLFSYFSISIFFFSFFSIICIINFYLSSLFAHYAQLFSCFCFSNFVDKAI